MALVGLPPCVVHVMLLQIPKYRKRDVTIIALVGFNSCVFHVMLLKISISSKRGVTIMALVGLLPCFSLHFMLLQIPRSKKIYVTIITLVGLNYCVFHVMLLQISISRKRGVIIMALAGLVKEEQQGKTGDVLTMALLRGKIKKKHSTKKNIKLIIPVKKIIKISNSKKTPNIKIVSGQGAKCIPITGFV